MSELVSKEIEVAEYKIIVKEATTKAGINRSLMIDAALKKEYQDEIDRIVGTFLYPSLVACSESANGKALPTFEEFLDLKDRDGDLWAQTAKEINPHWFTLEDTPETRQKKES